MAGMDINRQTLESAANFPTQIGYYLSGMEEVREQLKEAVKGMPDEEISTNILPEIHSIGQLILHNAEAEWWWLCHVVAEKELDEREAAEELFWDVLLDEEFAAKNYSLEDCWEIADKVRADGLEVLRDLSDDELDKFYGFTDKDNNRYEKSLRWILHHLIDHEAQHKGQIFMIKRLLQSRKQN
jgi:uncharacterized damage-inducible protein DinB